jgi:predicted metalloprotease
MRKRWLALVVGVAMAATLPATGAGTALAESGRTTAAGTSAKQPYDRILKLAIRDIQEYWTETLPAVYGFEYQRIPRSRIVAYDENTERGEFGECSDPSATYEDNAGNAFYCVFDDTIRYDNGTLFPDLYEAYEGNATALAVVMAHEWGHAIQARILTEDEFATLPTILGEQQADCFAGAWVAYVDEQKSRNLELEPGDVDVGVSAMLDVRDAPGSSAEDPNAHGSGFDRVGAFQHGFVGGAEACAPLLTEPLPIVQQPFSGENAAVDALRGGDLPYEEIPELLVSHLDLYWSQFEELQPYESVSDIIEYDATRKRTLPACETHGLRPSRPKPYDDTIFYCPDEDFIAFDADLMANVYDSIGDLGVMTLVSNAWAEAIQTRLDLRGRPVDLGLQADCFSGSWTGSLGAYEDGTLNGRGVPVEIAEYSLVLSPGDLDEVVQTFLVFADPADVEEARRGTAFERIGAFRIGYFSENPEAECLAITE